MKRVMKLAEAIQRQSTEVYGISHMSVPVTNLTRAAEFYAEGLGFPKTRSGEGWVDLDASSLLLRLVETSSKEQRASLRVQVANVELTWKALLEAGGRKLYEPARTPDLELAASLADPDGNTVTLWRALSEDEYGFVPELPVETEWSSGAQALLKSLLLAVPSLFRALARRKVVRLAEEMFPQRVITETDVVRAYILSSAKITRYRLREPLIRNGYNPDDFREEFDAE